MKKLYCVTMAGGSGTRFWPRSKVAKPKQYLDLFGNESLLQSTIQRFRKFIDKQEIFIVSQKSQATVLGEQAPEIPKDNLIYEPVGKNTLPCMGLVAMIAEKEDPECVMVISPADHLIQNDELFRDTVLLASKIACENNDFVTIGIPPSYPATGYGYVQIDREVTEENDIRSFKVKRFVEKPDLETAEAYMEQGGFYWNSGLFVFKVSVFLDAMKKFSPDLYHDLRKIQAEIGNPDFGKTLDTIYREVESISVDYGIMEHAQNISLVEGNFQWNDLGSWEAVYLISNKDKNGNYASGEAVFYDSSNSYVYGNDGVIALIGLDDVIVVRDGNTTLVCKRDKAEEVKMVVEQLKNQGRDQFL